MSELIASFVCDPDELTGIHPGIQRDTLLGHLEDARQETDRQVEIAIANGVTRPNQERRDLRSGVGRRRGPRQIRANAEAALVGSLFDDEGE
jgi:hypothetical protein